MTKASRKIARRAGTDRHFLISRTDHRRLEEIPTPRPETVRGAMEEAFPALLSGQRLLPAATERLNPCRRFGVLALRPDELPSAEEAGPSAAAGHWVAAAALVDAFCLRTGAFWGLDDDAGCLAVFLPEVESAACLEAAQVLQDEIRTRTAGTATAGAAAYPTIDYPRQETLANARKALDHAAFFGPNARVLFDAVSLNISGDRYYERGDIAAAVREFEHALRLDQTNVNVYNSLGVCHAVEGEYDRAMEQFSAALRLDAKEYMAVYNIGLIHALRGRREAALGFFLRSNELRGDVYEILLQTGRLYLEMDQPEGALPHLEHAARLRGRSSSVYRLLGDCYAGLGLTDQAIGAYKKAVKCNPGDAAALSALGCLFEQKGENPEIALVFCRESVRLAPENALFRRRLGAVHRKLNQFEEALEQFEHAGRLGLDAGDEIRQVRERMGGEVNQGILDAQ